MKMAEAEAIIRGEPNGFMVSFDWIDGCILRSDHFPDKHAGEALIPTEIEAWFMAAKFARAMRGKVVDVYVIKHDFTPVDSYKERYIKNR